MKGLVLVLVLAAPGWGQLWTATFEGGDLSELACDPSCDSSLSSSTAESHDGSRSLRNVNATGDIDNEIVNGLSSTHQNMDFWLFTTEAPASSRHVLTARTAADTELLRLIVGTSQLILVTVCEDPDDQLAAFTYSLNTWYHVVIDYDSVSGNLSVDIGTASASKSTSCTGSAVENWFIPNDSAGTPIFYYDTFVLSEILADAQRPAIMRTQ